MSYYERKSAAYLGDAEEGKDDAARAGRAPDEEHLGLEAGVAGAGVDEVRRRVADAEVPEPVASGGQGDSAGADRQGIDLTNHNPGTGTPC